MSDHRWSGWPGAWCLDCGCEDPMEIALADNDFDPGDPNEGSLGGWVSPEAQAKWRDHPGMKPCVEPGSNRHNPYTKRSER